jgi:hypothetical protein
MLAGTSTILTAYFRGFPQYKCRDSVSIYAAAVKYVHSLLHDEGVWRRRWVSPWDQQEEDKNTLGQI